MTTKLLLFAFYYLALGAIAPSLMGPQIANGFSLWMFRVSLGFALLAVFSFIWSILPEFEIKEEYMDSVEFVGSEVRV